MITTHIDKIVHQINMTPFFEKAFAFLRRKDLATIADGKIEIDGDRVFAIIQRYTTVRTDTPKFEFHRAYIDVQYVASGEEVIGWLPVGRLIATDPYDEGIDAGFGLAEKNKWTSLFLHKGQLAVFWPEDAHAPKIAAGDPAAALKIVIKVKAQNP